MRVEWKRAKIAFYLEQEKLIHRLDQEDPGHNPNDWKYWGYAVKPSVKFPELIGWMDYMYTVDLDSDSLIITACDDHYDSQSHGHMVYRLDNIPRWIFDLPMIDGHKKPPEGDDEDEEYEQQYEEYRLSESRYETDVHPVMRSEGVAKEHWNAYRPTPPPDPEMLELYSQFSPQRVPVEPKDIPERDLVWRKFQLLLLTHFFEHFLGVLRAISCFRRLGRNIPVFYQMAFAILCLAQGKNMKFRNENSLYKVLIGGNEDATPTWDPPKEDHYWLGKILIVLEPRLESEKHRHAAVGKVIKFASAQLQEKSDVRAVIFAIEWVVLVNINHTTQGLPQVTYSPTLPFLTVDMIQYSRPMRPPGFPTTGVVALLDVFSVPSPQPASYPFATEISQQIFRSANPDTQRALECSCRLFHIMAQEYPRVGDWILLSHIEGSESQFVAVSDSTGKKQAIKIESKRPRHAGIGGGLELILWSGGKKLVLEMPLYNITVVGGVLA